MSPEIFANDQHFTVHGVFGLFTFCEYLFHLSKWSIGVDGGVILRVDKANPLGMLVPDCFYVKFSQYWSDLKLQNHALALYLVMCFANISPHALPSFPFFPC